MTKIPRGEVIDPDLVEDEPTDYEFMSQASAAMEVLGADEAMAFISRRGERGRIAYAGELPLVELVQRGPSAIKELLGGGNFVIQYRKGLKVGGSSIINIEGDPIVPSVRRVDPAPSPTPAAPGFTGHPDPMAMLKEIIQEQSKATERLILAVVGNKPAKDDDAIFDKAIRIAELMKGDSKPGLSEDTMANLITKGIELAQKVQPGGGGNEDGGGGDGDDSLTGLVKAFQPTIHEVVRKKLLEPPPPAPIVAAAASPALPARAPEAAAPAPPVETKGDGVTPIWMVYLKPHIKGLLAIARDGKDPDLYSEVFLDQLPDGVYDELKEFAARPDFVELVCGNLPGEFAPYPAYMKKFVTLVKEKLTAPESPLTDEDEDDEGGGSDMG